jgi:hypothetical protein
MYRPYRGFPPWEPDDPETEQANRLSTAAHRAELDQLARRPPLTDKRKGMYVFSGVTPFIEVCARDAEVEAPHMVKCEKIWHVAQIQDALGQLPRLQPGDRAPLFHQVDLLRNSLAAALAGCDAAIAEVAAACATESDPIATTDERITRFQRRPGKKAEATPPTASLD